MKKHYKPTLRAICAVGTVAHNRPFTSAELQRYVSGGPRSGAQLARWLKRHKLVELTSDRKLWPTVKGWNMIEKACRR